MSGIGPVEPGEDTYHHPAAPLAGATRPRLRLTVPPRHRRKAALVIAATLAAGGCVYVLTAPSPPPGHHRPGRRR